MGFIRNAAEDNQNLHLAVTNEFEEYLGTISLKCIDSENHTAEFAIVLRNRAMGTGAAIHGVNEILYIAFQVLHLHRVYLYVRSDNLRAVRFYEKIGLRFEGEFIDHLCIQNTYKTIKWYALLDNEYAEWQRKNNLTPVRELDPDILKHCERNVKITED